MTDTARNIIRQLGAGRFVLMTGATLTVGTSEVQAKMKAAPRNKPNVVRVVYNGALDLYDVVFYRVANRGLKVKTVRTVNNVYGDQLQGLISRETGLALSL